MLKWPNIAWLILPILFLVSCNKETEPGGPEHRQVLLVYLAADNNLGGEAGDKISALCKGWNGNVRQRIVIYADLAGSGAELFEVTSPDVAEDGLLSIESYSQENSASATVFARVIREVRNRYPADDYGLLLFSHASGWLPQGTLTDPFTTPAAGGSPTRTVAMDGSIEMELADFAAAIPDGLFSRIIFESCFMAGIEVAYELRHKAPWILASSAEIVSPGFTASYFTAQEALFADSPQTFGESVFRRVMTYSDYRNSATFSLIRTSELEALAGFIRDNCDPQRTVEIPGIQCFDRNRNGSLFFDFEDYYSRLLRPGADAARLSQLIEACVPWKAATDGFMNQSSGMDGFAIARHSGLTVYIPQAEFPFLNSRYSDLQWSIRTGKE